MFLYVWMIMQIIAENLPISSSGHVILAHAIMNRYGLQVTDILYEHMWAFDYLLQGVSAVVFIIYFFTSWWQLVFNQPVQLRILWDIHSLKKLIPVFIFGFIVDGITWCAWLIGIADYIHMPLIIGLLFTTEALWSLRYVPHQTQLVPLWSAQHAYLLGVVQGLALLPGISRFGTTFVVLRRIGYSNHNAFLVSFLVQWPLIVAGSLLGYKKLYDLGILSKILNFQIFMVMVLLGILGYAVLAIVNMMINKNTLWKFSYYMILPILLAWYI